MMSSYTLPVSFRRQAFLTNDERRSRQDKVRVSVRVVDGIPLRHLTRMRSAATGFGAPSHASREAANDMRRRLAA